MRSRFVQILLAIVLVLVALGFLLKERDFHSSVDSSTISEEDLSKGESGGAADQIRRTKKIPTH